MEKCIYFFWESILDCRSLLRELCARSRRMAILHSGRKMLYSHITGLLAPLLRYPAPGFFLFSIIRSSKICLIITHNAAPTLVSSGKEIISNFLITNTASPTSVAELHTTMCQNTYYTIYRLLLCNNISIISTQYRLFRIVFHLHSIKQYPFCQWFNAIQPDNMK